MVAGEASGDLHGARLLVELQRLRPDVRAFGLGGDELAAVGFDAVAHSSEISVVGLIEVLRVLRRARSIFRLLLAEVDRRRPAVAVLIDSPDFNLRLARELKRRGVKVLYYISPQVWAWRKGRVRQIERLVDRMLVLFPFEAAFYRQHGVAADCVGHPLVDEVPVLRQAWDASVAPPLRVALLPGSRASEVDRLLPLMIEAASQLAAAMPVEVSLIRAATITASRLEPFLAAARTPIVVVSTGRHEHLASCHLALCASGTATLEVGLLGTPLIVLYRLQRWTYWLARWLVKLPHISLVNLVLGRGVVPELLQDEAEPGRVASLARRLLLDPEAIAIMRSGLAELRSRLGAAGAAGRAAAVVAEEMVGVAR